MNSGNDIVMMDDITDWLEVDAHDPGHGVRTGEEFSAYVELAREDSPSPKGEDVHIIPRKKLSDKRTCFNTIINFMGETDSLRLMPYHPLTRGSSIIIDKIQKELLNKKQFTFSDYFKHTVHQRPTSQQATALSCQQALPAPHSSTQAISPSQVTLMSNPLHCCDAAALTSLFVTWQSATVMSNQNDGFRLRNVA